MIPKVIIDARMVGPIPHGIARYVSELARGLENKNRISPLLYEPIFLIRPITELGSQIQTFGSFKTLSAASPFLSPRELLELPRILKQNQARLYHSPSFSSLWKCPCPSVVTIHDLNHLIYGSWAKKLYYQTLLKHFALRSKVITTVSEFSKKELSSWLRIPESHIEVVHNSLEYTNQRTEMEPNLSESLLEKHCLTPKHYFFCLSNSKPHKNLSLLVHAYQDYRNQNPHAWPLVLNVEKMNAFSHSPGVKAVGSVSGPDATLLLNHSGGMLFPSLYEGFGLPPLEAALAGIPLAVSRIPPHEEGLVDLSDLEVCWTPPDDRQGWTRAFQRIQNGEISAVNSEHQIKILQRFNTERLAQRMDQIYRNVLEREL